MKTEKILLIGFALSSMSALIYEVVWSRELTYIFGTSVYAVSTVLATFMFGLALGSFIFGKLVDRQENPLRLFALLEIGLGVYGIIVIGIFSLIVHPYRFLYSLLHGSSLLFLSSQFILAFIALILPTTLIGGTFPVMSKIYTEEFDALGEKVGVVYSLNTVGAAVGAFSSGFVLMPILGLNRTTLLAAFVNLAVGAIIYDLSNKTISKIVEKVKHKKVGLRTLDKVILVSFFFSGFAALTYEVVWTRFLSLIFGTSVYAFSTMLTAFMVGLALGSYAVSKVVDSINDPVGAFILVEWGIGIYGMLLLLLFSNLDMLYFNIYSRWSASFSSMWFVFFLVFFSLLLIPTMLMGATLPLVSKIYSRDLRTVGGDIGAVFSSNTFGGIFGAFLAGFVLIPSIGIEKASLIAAAMNICIVVVLFRFSKIRKEVFLLIFVIFSIIGVSLSTYGVDPLQAGVYYNTNRFSNASDYEEFKAETELLFKKDDPHGLVTVTKGRGTTALHINGKIDANNVGDIPNEYMLAYAPLFTHEDPKRVLNIGLGGGFTLSAIEDLDVEQIDVIEINPAVVEATRQVFYQYNDNALDDPRVNLIIADARNYLFTSDEKYDVIISEPSNPWLAGEGGLFTREFYELVKQHLYKGGVFAQWVPLYDHRAEDFKVFLKTYQSVFPYVQVYKIKGDAILVGSRELRGLDYLKLRERLDGDRVKEHLARMKRIIEYPGLSDVDYYLSFYLMNSEEIPSYIAETQEINSDDKPLLDFRTAKVHIMKGVPFKERPLADIMNFKLKREGMVLRAPPLTNMASIDGGNHTFDLLGVAFEDVNWPLLDVGYWHSLSAADPGRFDILRSVIYATPFGELVWIRLDGVSGEVGKEAVKIYLADSQNILVPHLRDVGEMEIDLREAYLFTDGVKMFAAWQCIENEAIYVLMLPYTEDIGGAKEVFGHVRCIY